MIESIMHDIRENTSATNADALEMGRVSRLLTTFSDIKRLCMVYNHPMVQVECINASP